MPAISLGLSEIEERLETVRFRLNLELTVRVACAAVAVVCVAATVALATGLYHRLSAGGHLGAAATLTLVVTASISAWLTWRRWIDLPAAARVADQRAELAERLTTLVWLRQLSTRQRLMPLLVAQLVALSPRWQPPLVAPFRVPREAYAGVGSLAALLLATWLAPAPPAPPLRTPEQQAATAPVTAGAETDQRRAADAPPSSKTSSDTKTDPKAGNDGAAGQSPRGDGPKPNTDDTPGEDRIGRIAASPDAVTGAGASAPQPDAHPAGGPRSGNRPDARPRPGNSEPSAEAARLQASQDDASQRQGELKQDGAGPQSAKKESANPGSANRNDGNTKNGEQPQTPPSSFAGVPPKAGAGSSPSNIMAQDAASAAALGDRAPQTYRLTITSFLQATESSRPPTKHTGKRGGTAEDGDGTPQAADPVPSELQRNDDVLRKAEIPIEFEEIVRRVYSARANP